MFLVPTRSSFLSSTRILPQGKCEMPYRESQAMGVKSSLCFVWKISVLVLSSRMERGWRSVAMAKRATGDLSAGDFCCPRRNLRRPRKFKAFHGLENMGVKQTRVVGTGCALIPMGHKRLWGNTLQHRRSRALPGIPRSYPAGSGSGR